MPKTFFTHIECSRCHKTYSAAEIHTFCPACGRALVATYDLEAAKKSLNRAQIQVFAPPTHGRAAEDYLRNVFLTNELSDR